MLLGLKFPKLRRRKLIPHNTVSILYIKRLDGIELVANCCPVLDFPKPCGKPLHGTSSCLVPLVKARLQQNPTQQVDDPKHFFWMCHHFFAGKIDGKQLVLSTPESPVVYTWSVTPFSGPGLATQDQSMVILLSWTHKDDWPRPRSGGLFPPASGFVWPERCGPKRHPKPHQDQLASLGVPKVQNQTAW